MGPKKPVAKKAIKSIDNKNTSISNEPVNVNIIKVTENNNEINTDDILKLANQYWDGEQSNVSVSVYLT